MQRWKNYCMIYGIKSRGKIPLQKSWETALQIRQKQLGGNKSESCFIKVEGGGTQID